MVDDKRYTVVKVDCNNEMYTLLPVYIGVLDLAHNNTLN